MQVNMVGPRVKNTSLLQPLGLGDWSTNQPPGGITSAENRLWSLPYKVCPFPVLAFEIIGGYFVSNRFTKVKAWNEKPTNKGGRLTA